ncbi:hypothetical protein SAMN05216352_104183 [Alteribacillus bidgolensis]|uniref:Uncharacterized protein n=1 Tax=Alteribacillus bidgolensis TaxID=930129 RepID=A0A1G8HAY3_9BACI|nr:hypothetical protein SAMN05216352_104183 [Alteribacillus bidgolensis]
MQHKTASNNKALPTKTCVKKQGNNECSYRKIYPFLTWPFSFTIRAFLISRVFCMESYK